MKKFISLFLALVCCLGMAFAAKKGKCGENVTWVIDKSGTLTISGTGATYDYDYKKDSPIKGNSDIRKVIIEDGVTKIGSRLITSSGAESVTIPKSVVSVHPLAFSFNWRFSTITVDPNNPNYCDVDGALFSKDKTILVRYPDGKKDAYTIPDGVQEIGDYAFFDAYASEVIMPNSVKKIGYQAFAYSNMKRVVLSNSITTIGRCAFQSCKHLSEITLPSGLNTLGEDAFKYCESLRTVRYPKGLSIASAAVPSGAGSPYDPKSSTSSTSNSAFAQSQSQTKSTPQNSCGDGLTWEYSSGTLTIKGEGKMKDYSNGTAPWAKYAGSITTIMMDNTIFKIGAYAFAGCAITEITIPNSVAEIGDFAFYKCTSLKTLSFPPSVKSVGRYALGSCESLWKVMLPGSCSYSTSLLFPAKAVKYTYNPNTQSDPNYSVRHIITPESLAKSKQDTPTTSSGSQQQSTSTTAKNMPLLTMVDGSLEFVDPSNNNRIDADEKCVVRFKVANNGKGAAYNCEARVTMSGTSAGITTNNVKIPTISVGQSRDVEIPITSSVRTQEGKVTLSIEVFEPGGWGIPAFDMTVATKAFEQPYLQVVDYNIASKSGKIKKLEQFTVSFYVQNTKHGDAEQVRVKVKYPANVFVADGSDVQSFPVIKPGEAKLVQLSLLANNNYQASDIPVTIEINEKYGQFAENKQVSVALNQVTSSSFNIAAKDEPKQERKEIQLATIGSAVDKNIPVSQTKNTNTFVVIIANENYKHVAKVPYALNDGNIFRQYCEKTLGVPAQHIHMASDATYMEIKDQIDWLAGVMDAYQGRARIIFYYAGHGVPDEQSKTAFLLPVDGKGSDVSTGYKLDNLYNTLGSMPSEGVTVFMDACFSGSKREEGMLASARGVAVRTKSGVPQGKMVVFSAAQGDETAYPNKDEQHGMFTYYLLKKLQDTKGDVTLQDLGNYITTNVRQQSIVKNGKSQTPNVTPSASLNDEWQNWKLK